MKILLLGSGGREHALAWKISQSENCSQLFIAPGNTGTALCGMNIDIKATDFDALYEFTSKEQIDFIVCGPEDPLVEGVFDYFKDKNIPLIGPSKAAAQLEGSKAFSKKFMQRHQIPTAAYLEVDATNIQEGIQHIENTTGPYVLKADGLAAGKGVLIIQEREEAKASLIEMIEQNKFGKASARVVIEEFLDGIEFSVFVLSDSHNYLILPNAKDYKRIGEGDTGLNTGGMGAISPVPFVDKNIMQQVEEKIIRPTINGLQKDHLLYKGFIYFGLIKVGDTIKVIEYNCRMGDPETEVVMPRIQNDIVDLFIAVNNESINNEKIIEDERACCTIVLASGGYPEEFEKGKIITGLENKNLVFHAGIKKVNDDYITNGGRVAMVSAYGKNIQEALQMANQKASTISYDNIYYRKDIGWEFE
ncbi:MAG: phosphoribosylamine--glycine ligase [Bacteroidota bacterium]